MAKMYLCSLFIFAVFSGIEVNAQALRPDYFQFCSRSDPKLSECMVDKVQAFIPNLLKGDPEIGLPPMNPLVIDHMRIERDITQHVKGKVTVRNVKLFNLESADLQAIRPDIQDSKFDVEADVRFPMIMVEGNYRSEVNFRGIPITNKGVFNLTLNEVTVSIKLAGKPYKNDGEDYIQIQEAHMKPEIGDMKIYISDLFGGNNDFSELALEFANRYWYIFYSEFLPHLEERWEPIIKDIANRALSRVPYDHMFPA